MVGRLRRRAFGGNVGITAGGAMPEASDRGAVRFEIASSGDDSFETEKLRLSGFQNANFVEF